MMDIIADIQNLLYTLQSKKQLQKSAEYLTVNENGYTIISVRNHLL